VLELDDKLTQQYKMMFLQDAAAPTGEASGETEVIKLFD
jgi:hypothetical protein